MRGCAFLFEVLDKAPALSSLWSFFGALAVVGFLLGRLRFWMLPLPFMIAAAAFVVLLGEFIDVGLINPAAPFASGESPSYVIQFPGAAAVSLILPICGAAQHFKKVRSGQQVERQ